VAESRDRASLLGIDVARTQTIVWVITSVLASAAMILRAGIYGLPVGSAFGPSILLRALAAAVIGRMEKLPTIFVASLALGVVESSIVFASDNGKLVDPILFVVVLGALLLQRRSNGARVSEDEQSSWQASRQVRPVPAELASLPEIVWGRRIATAVGVLVLFGLPLILNEGQINLAAVVLILAMVGVSLVVLTGWAGQVSLGQVAFMGIGAAVGGYLSLRGWDIAIAVPVAGMAGALGAMVIGLPALRVRGLYLAVVTLAFALATSSYFLDADFIHWVPDTSDRIARPFLFGRISLVSEARMYVFVVVVFLICVWAVHGLRNSRSGRVLIGVRENPRAAQAFGVNTTTAKLMAFAIAGFIAAVAGAVFVHHQTALGNSAYTVQESRDAFIMVVIGGLGSVPGALLGAVFIQGSEYFRSSFPQSIQPVLGFLTSGVGLMVVLLFLPGGFSQLYYAQRDRILKFVAQRRGIHVPSLIADSAQHAPAPEQVVLDLTDALTEEQPVVVA
jgi:branched-chain amino acid transport system permease protein